MRHHDDARRVIPKAQEDLVGCEDLCALERGEGVCVLGLECACKG